MQIVKETLEIDEVLEKRITNLLKFNNIKAKLKTGNMIALTNTNIAYVEPHTFKIKEITYFFFNENDHVYINDLSSSIFLKELLLIFRVHIFVPIKVNNSFKYLKLWYKLVYFK